MELTEDQIIEKYVKKGEHCGRDMLLPYEYGWTCVSCGCNVIKRKHELSKISRKKMNFINRLKYAEHKKLCIFIEVHKKYDGTDFYNLFEALSKLKNKKLKINNILIETYKYMNEHPDIEQNYYSRTATGLY